MGIHIYGEGATELIHVGQMALLGGMSLDVFVESIFNFPTLAEAYRVAALDVLEQQPRTGAESGLEARAKRDTGLRSATKPDGGIANPRRIHQFDCGSTPCRQTSVP